MRITTVAGICLLAAVVQAQTPANECVNTQAIQCLVTNFGTDQTCLKCIEQAAATIDPAISLAGCPSWSDEICGKLNTCEMQCGECLDEAVNIFLCGFNSKSTTCTVSCGYPTAAPVAPSPTVTFSESTPTSPAPTLSIQEVCAAETSRESVCLGTKLSLTEIQVCRNCLFGITDQIPNTFLDCDNAQDLICRTLQECEGKCRDCYNDVGNSFICGLNEGLKRNTDGLSGCSVECESITDNNGESEVCESEFSFVDACGPSAACTSCVANIVEVARSITFSTCRDLEQEICAELSDCADECDSCHNDMVRASLCALNDGLDRNTNGFSDCNVYCLGVGGGGASQDSEPPTITPVPATSPVAATAPPFNVRANESPKEEEDSSSNVGVIFGAVGAVAAVIAVASVGVVLCRQKPSEERKGRWESTSTQTPVMDHSRSQQSQPFRQPQQQSQQAPPTPSSEKRRMAAYSDPQSLFNGPAVAVAVPYE